jgi:hypothetical protein
MPSSYTTSARFTLQATGENNNTWGVILNNGVFQLVDDNVNGRLAFTLSGTKVLTSNLGATDEARMATLDVTGGTGGAVVIPSVAKLYVIRNGSTGVVTVGTSGGTAASFQPSEVGQCYCDGAITYRVRSTDFGGAQLTGVGAPTTPNGVVNKAYADNLAFSAINLPGQGGQAGNYLKSDGTAASWVKVSGADLVPASVQTATLADGAVTTPKIAAGAVTTPLIANGAVTNAQIAAGAVDYLKYSSPYIQLSAAAGASKQLQFLTGATIRWAVGANPATETGGNAGADFEIDRFSDTGAFLGSPIIITRSTGALAFNGGGFTANCPINVNASGPGNTTGYGLQSANKNRWSIISDSTAESGGNAGSNFDISRFDDSGAFIDYPLTINRASGMVTFGKGLSSFQDVQVTAPSTGAALVSYVIDGVIRLRNGYSNGIPGWGVFTYTNTGAFGTSAITVRMADGGTAFPANLAFNTATAPNLYMDSSGYLIRSTSSRRYKRDIKTYAPPTGAFDKLRAVTYRSRSEHDDPDLIHVGLIAEEVDEAGLKAFVVYDDKGRPEALEYDRMVALLIAEVQALRKRVAALEAA